MGIEFVFFNETLRDRFVKFVSAKGIACQTQRNERDERDGFVVELPEDLDDPLSDAIEAEYELLMKEEMLLAESEGASHSVMGVAVTLSDGRPCTIRIPGAIGRRLAEHFTPEEIHNLVSIVAQGIENPIDGPLCRMT